MGTPGGGLRFVVRRTHPDLYSTQDVADWVGRSKDTIERWRREGILVPSRYMKVGRMKVWLYTEEDVHQARALARMSGHKPRSGDASRKKAG